MNFHQKVDRPLISGALTVVSTRTFVLMLLVTPACLLTPRVVPALLGLLVIISLVVDWHATSRAFGRDR